MNGGYYLLELLRRAIAQRGMEAHSVIVLLDEGLDVLAQVCEIPIPVRVDLLPLQRLQKTLAAGVVVRVRRPAHARNHVVLLKELHIRARGILDAPIRVMHQAGRRLTGCDRVVQRVQRYARRERLVQRPAHHLARVPIQEDRQVGNSVRRRRYA